MLVLIHSGPLHGQGITHGFVELGAGATDLNGGVDWLIAGGPIGVGGEVGVGWVFLTAVTGSYHFAGDKHRKYDLFATVGYAGLGSSEFSSHGFTLGGGTTYWPRTHVGVRFDALRFLPVAIDNNVPANQRSPAQYWGVRGGVAFRFR